MPHSHHHEHDQADHHSHGSHHDHHGHHSHIPSGSGALSALKVALFLNASFLVLELLVGLFSNSLALLSDAGHMVSDVAALALAAMAERLSQATPRASFTFGFKRLPVLGGFANALTLLAIVVIIFWQAWQRLIESPEVMGWPVLLVGAAGLLVNLVSAWWLHRSASDSINIRGAILHLMADSLGSLGAIVAAIVIITTGWTPIDALVSVLIGLLILLATLPLLRDAMKVLLQAAPASVDMADLRQFIENANEVEQIIDLHVWELDSGQVMLTGTFETNCGSISVLHRTAAHLHESFNETFGISHATIEWCPADHSGVESHFIPSCDYCKPTISLPESSPPKTE